MSRKIEATGDILAEIANYIVLAALQIFLFQDFLGQWPGNLKMAGFVLVPLFYYLVRTYCKRILPFLALHILPVAAVIQFYSAGLAEKVIFGVTAVFCAFISFGQKLSGKGSGMGMTPPPFMAGILFAIYLLDAFQTEGICGVYLMRLMIVYLFLFFLYLYLTRFVHYMDMNNRTTEHIPMYRAFFASFGLMGGFAGISMVLICLFSDRQLADKIASFLGKLLKTVILFLISLLPVAEEEAESVAEGMGSGAAESMMLMEKTEPSFLLKLLNFLTELLSAAVTIALILGMVIGFVRLVKWAFSLQGNRRILEAEEGDKIEFLAVKKKKIKTREKEPFFAFARTPSQAVRRQYMKTLYRKYKVLKEEKTEKLILSGTARECCENLFQKRQQEAADFTVLYEKARYSEEDCSREDVKQMKQLSALLLKAEAGQ